MDFLRLAFKAGRWLKRLGWKTVTAGVAMLVVGFLAGRASKTGGDVPRAEVERIQWADAGANKNLAALKAALASKDREIKDLNERLENIECDGDWTRERGVGGEIVERCVGKVRVVKEDRQDRGTVDSTPLLPPPFLAPPPLPVAAGDRRVKVGIGGGVSTNTAPVVTVGIGVNHWLLATYAAQGWLDPRPDAVMVQYLRTFR